MTRPKMSFRASARNPAHGCFAALSMTGWGQQTSPSGPSPFVRRGTFWRKPKQGEVARSSKHFFVIPSIFFCHSKCSFLSFRAPARNPVWMLRCAQHDKDSVIPNALSCHSECQRGIQCVGSLQKERDVCKANRGRSIPCMDIKPLTEKNAAAYAQYLTNMRDQIGSNAPATGKDYRHPCVPAIVGQAER